MSRTAALVITIAAATAARLPAPTADRAMTRYKALLAGAEDDPPSSCPDTPAASGEIVVCGRSTHPPPRLPMPEDRFADGEVVHHPNEPARATGAFSGPPHESSRQWQTLGRVFGLLREAATGEDPDD